MMGNYKKNPKEPVEVKTAKELADEYIEKNWDNWNWKWKNRLLESIRPLGD